MWHAEQVCLVIAAAGLLKKLQLMSWELV